MNHNHHHDHERCKELFASLSEYIDNELSDGKCEEIKKHLEACGCCRTCIESLKKTIELCGAVTEVPVPKHLSEKLRRIAEQESLS